MRVAYYTEQGPAERVLHLGEIATPLPGPGEVRVRLRASGANPSDWKARSGARGIGMSAPLIIPHSDGAGDIDATGAGARHRMGERVWIWNGQWRRAHGTAAEYIVLPAAQAMSLPDGTTYEEGACLGIPALTALQALRLADTAPGMAVLVVGGAGSVGHYIVQLARQRGARVIATVSSGAKAEHAGAGGADVIIDYRTEDLPARIAEITNGLGVDIVFELDIAMNAAAYPLLVRPHGKIIVYGTSTDRATIPALWLMRHAVPVLPFLVYDVSTADRRAGLEQLNALLRTAALTHTIAAALPLERIADAHRLGESGKAIGNIVLAVGP